MLKAITTKSQVVAIARVGHAAEKALSTQFGKGVPDWDYLSDVDKNKMIFRVREILKGEFTVKSRDKEEQMKDSLLFAVVTALA
jgi:hypothetical protein